MSYSLTELCSLSLQSASEMLRRREISSKELTTACLKQIESHDAKLNAFITVTRESALQEAGAADAEIRDGRVRGALHGIPIAIKDLVDTAGVKTTAASKVFESRIPLEDATVIRRLREAGAVIMGKTNLHEFAYGGSGVISAYGPVRNPWNPAKTTGGSSSGSAAAEASGMCFAAIGTDTAGSIRLPASFCGIVGLKPTYGLVSAVGVIPLCWSYDHVGPMTRTVTDAALVLDAIAGYDAEDAGSREGEYARVAGAIDSLPQGLKLGVAGEFFCEDLDAEVKRSFKTALEKLEQVLGTRAVDVKVPMETSSVVRVAEPYAYHEELIAQFPDRYQPATLERIKTGEGISAAKYLKVKRELEVLRRRSVAMFREVDVIATPTVPCLPYGIDDLVANPAELRPKELRMLRNTRPFNTLGWPTISVPCGTELGMPVGLQLAAAPGQDGLLLQVTRAFEKTNGESAVVAKLG